MELEARIEIAEKVAEIINDADATCKARAWNGGDNVRVYTANGYAIIDEAGNCNVDGLKSYCYKAALNCDDHGIKTYRA